MQAFSEFKCDLFLKRTTKIKVVAKINPNKKKDGKNKYYSVQVEYTCKSAYNLYLPRWFDIDRWNFVKET